MQVEVSLDYKANPKQRVFHGMQAKYRGFCGGWGNGKTTAGCVETFMRLMEFPKTECIIARKTRPELKATTWKMFMQGDTSKDGWHGVPKECIKLYNRSDLYLELVNGSVVHGVPLDDPAKLENYNLGLFWVDQAEEIEEDIFLKFHGRLRQQEAPREGLLTFNPNGHNWLWRRFIDSNRSHSFARQYGCVEATPFDNPNLPEDYLEQFENLPKHWYERFVMGSHEVFVGQIFTDYNPDIHVIDPFRIPSDWERWSCFDPGLRHEGALSWVARDYEGNAYYYREVVEAGHDIAWWADRWLEEEMVNDAWGGPDEDIYRRLVGPEARIRAQTDGRSVISLLNDAGVFPEFSDRDPTARISRITEYLRPTVGHVPPFGYVDEADVAAPRLYIFSTCAKLQEWLPQYRWKPQRTNFTEEDTPEKPRKKDDHNIDCLGHILVAFDDESPMLEGRDRPRRNAEDRLLDEHFEAELAAAGGRIRGKGYRGRSVMV